MSARAMLMNDVTRYVVVEASVVKLVQGLACNPGSNKATLNFGVPQVGGCDMACPLDLTEM